MSKVEIELKDVQLLWDQVVTSMDWGSGFLDEEEMWRIILIGHQFGFDVRSQIDRPYSQVFFERMKKWDADNPRLGFNRLGRNHKEATDAWAKARTAHIMTELDKAVAKYDMTDPYNPGSDK